MGSGWRCGRRDAAVRRNPRPRVAGLRDFALFLRACDLRSNLASIRALLIAGPGMLEAFKVGPKTVPGGGRALRGIVAVAFLAAAFAWLASCFPAAALEVEVTNKSVRREIIALYDSRHEKKPDQTRIHKFAEMPLNFLGLTVRYVDVNGPLPDPAEVVRARGMMSWLIEPMARPAEYVDWLDRVTEKGVRFALISEIAPPESERMRPAIDRVLGRLGLRPTGDYVNITNRARFAEVDPAMVGFERPLDKAIPDFALMTAAGKEVKVHLAAEVPRRDGKVTAALVTTSPGGGYVSDEFAMFYDGNVDRLRWILNPFLFFKKVFGEDRFPIPDVTTLSGRRIYFSHIDGDGWNNVSEIEGYRQAQVVSAEVIAKEAIEPYSDLPVSIGLVAGDFDASLGGNPAAGAIARRVFALPQVEVASHTYTHPFEWEFFDKYDRQAELERIEKAHRDRNSLWDKVRVVAWKIAGRDPPSDKLNRWIAGSADLPRAYMRLPYDLDKEIKGALAVSEKFAPPGKRAKLMLWSGDTVPGEAAVRATREAGVRNMNGGDTRLDEEYPSVFYVPPIARPVGRERQIYAGNSNENTYTNNWHGPFYGYLNLEKTLVNTEKPRRLKPFNVYYHTYMGEKAASLASLRHFLDLARKSEVVPIAASHYAAIADSFFAATIEQIGLQAWSIANRGELQTVRFDDADSLEVTMSGSVGVLGSRRTNGALYVALDPAVASAVVALQARASASPAVAQTPPQPASDPGQPADALEPPPPRVPVASLVSSRWVFSGRKLNNCGMEISAYGYGPGQMLWQTAPNKQFAVSASRGATVLWTSIARADAEGALALQVPALAMEPLVLRFECHD